MRIFQTQKEEMVEMNNIEGVENDTTTTKKMAESTVAAKRKRGVNLLDLSDDVLLYILKYCDPMDLKALGFTCARLGALVLDRSLWQRVDLGEACVGVERLRWLVAHALHPGTDTLKLQGYSRLARGCLGHMNVTRKDLETNNKWAEEKARERGRSLDGMGSSSSTRQRPTRHSQADENLSAIERLQNHFQISIQQLPRLSGSPLWPDDESQVQFDSEFSQEPTNQQYTSQESEETSSSPSHECPGPLFTVTPSLLAQLKTRCPHLTSLALEYCNINCKTISPSLFPSTLKWLSLRGVKCYNIPLDKSFLFKIQDFLPDLEYLDVSECEWFEPASLMPISKIPGLKELRAEDCVKLTEFVAYASIACRYGFKKLESLDVRGSPLGDSEVAALGWLPALTHLRLAAAPRARGGGAGGGGGGGHTHTHYRTDPLPLHHTLQPWERREPEYYKQSVESANGQGTSDGESLSTPDEERKKFDNVTVINLRPNDYILTSPMYTWGVGWKEPTNNAVGQNNNNNSNQINNNQGNNDQEANNNGGDNDQQSNNNQGENGEQSNKNQGEEQSSEHRDENKKHSKENQTENDEHSNENKVDKELQIKRSGNNLTPKRKNDVSDEDMSEEGPSSKKKKYVDIDKPSTSKDTLDPDSDGDGPSKLAGNAVNSGASTSSNTVNLEHGNTIHFRRNAIPILITEGRSGSNDPNRPNVAQIIIDGNMSRPEFNGQDHAAENGGRRVEVNLQGPAEPEGQRNRRPNGPEAMILNRHNINDCHPRHQVLYVNVGQQLHAVYRLSIETGRQFYDQMRGRAGLNNPQDRPFSPPLPYAPEIDPRSLVTDSSIRRFGQADDDNINYVNIGPNGPVAVPVDARLHRSNLRVLSVTGYRYITNASLMHLATAAPHLTLIDFTRTMVTPQGVEYFKSLRPDVEIRYSNFNDSENSSKE